MRREFFLASHFAPTALAQAVGTTATLFTSGSSFTLTSPIVITNSSELAAL